MHFKTIRFFLSLFISISLIFSGAGLFTTYFPIFAKKSLSDQYIGFITSFYYVGFLLGSLFITRVMKLVGHIRAFIFILSLLALSSLSFSLFPSIYIWFFLRFLMGFGLSGVYILTESWLSYHASIERRGKTFAIYRIIELVAWSVGTILIDYFFRMPSQFYFSLVTLLIIISAIPLSLTQLPQPEATLPFKFNLKVLWETSQYSTVTAFLIGLSNSAIWLMTPLFLLSQNIKETEIPYYLIAYIFGGLLSHYPLGMLSDKVDRRIVVTIQAAMAGATSFFLISFKLPAFFILGLVNMPIYSVVTTHALDRSNPEDYGRISAQLLFTYSMGAIFGPLLCGYLLTKMGAQGYAYQLIVVFSLMAVFGLYQKLISPPVPSSQKESFRLLPEGFLGIEWFIKKIKQELKDALSGQKKED
jgi:MFS family permease